MMRILLEDLLNLSESELLLSQTLELSEGQTKRLDSALKRLAKHEPVQYITGRTNWFDLDLKVSPAALIPRPETEELLMLIRDSGISPHRAIDIGTGTGCIALGLKRTFSQTVVTAVDISEDALQLAAENSELNDIEIDLYRRDILHWERDEWDMYDLIVSNPPYVSSDDKLQMAENVLKFEPHLALFSEDDPLKFYKRIYDFSLRHLNDEGILYFEINEAYGSDVVSEGESRAFDAELIKDFFGKNRFVRAKKKALKAPFSVSLKQSIRR